MLEGQVCSVLNSLDLRFPCQKSRSVFGCCTAIIYREVRYSHAQFSMCLTKFKGLQTVVSKLGKCCIANTQAHSCVEIHNCR